jgi:hypothetical protein
MQDDYWRGRLRDFGAWFNVRLAAADKEVSLWYRAPMDTSPRLVTVKKAFKNGKLRVQAGDITFTADHSHASRFYWTTKGA